MCKKKEFNSPFIPDGMAQYEDILHCGPTSIIRLWIKPGCEAKMHTHTEDTETIIVENGHGLIVWVNEQRYELEKGKDVTCHKGSTHYWKNTSQFTAQILCVKVKH